MMTETKNNERVFTNRRERNYGIDLLRIVSMIMVTILHFSGYGGFLGTPENGLSYYVLSLIMVICYGAVDIFAIISGFVMYNSTVKYTKIINLWFQVVFYSYIFLILDKQIFHRPINILNVLSASFPVTISDNLWYFAAYFIMFFFIPLYNKIISSFANGFLFNYIIICFAILFIPTNISILGLLDGYSFLWLSLCYLIGAFIKKNENFFNSISNRIYVVIIIVGILITYCCYMPVWDNINIFINYSPKDILEKYNSLTVLLPSISFLMLFSRMNIKRGKRIIRFFSSTSFSVYIIQCLPFTWNNIITKLHTFFNAPTALEKIGLVLGVSVMFYLAASLVDSLRIQLFRLLHIDMFINLICKLFSKIINAIKWQIKKHIKD